MTRTLALAALLCASAALAQSPPLEVKGVPLGASMVALQTQFPEASCYVSSGVCVVLALSRADKRCGMLSNTPSAAECRGGALREVDFGPARAPNYTFNFADDKLGRATVEIWERDYAEVVIALKEKYGQPTSDKTTPVQNRMGAKFESRVVVWERSDGSIEARQREGKIDKGAVIIVSEEYVRKTTKETIDEAKAAAKNL